MTGDPGHTRLPHIVPAGEGASIHWRSEMLVKAASAHTEARFGGQN